jgi:putative hydrolase of the HAD superfamily
MSYDAVVLDVGGVLLLPDPEVTGAALAAVGVRARDLVWAHYGGVAAVDAHAGAAPQADTPGRYLGGFVEAAGVAGTQAAVAAEALHAVFARPSLEVWRHPTPWARSDLRALGGLDLPVAVVSNSDGSVARLLHDHRLAQVGSGPGLDVAVIVDSAVVGVAKPDPAIFEPALAALALPPDRCLYVGDTVTFDVAGARAAGLHGLHLDPLGTCAAVDHPHARTLADAW